MTTFDAYDARGNVTAVTDPQGVTTTLQYRGGRLVSATAAGLTTSFWYDGQELLALQRPTGSYSVRCYRKDTITGEGCSGGQKTAQVQWEATAADSKGKDWSEAIVYSHWPDGAIKRAEYQSRLNGTRRVVTYHPNAHGQRTFTRWGVGPGGYTSTSGFDATGNVTGIGLPFNMPEAPTGASMPSGYPDFCRVQGSTEQSKLCAALGYDAVDRLTHVTEFLSDSSADKQMTLFAYDATGNVASVRSGCAEEASCQAPIQTYQYDDFGNLVRVQLPHAAGPVRYNYDARGNLTVKQTETMRQAGEWVEYTYDALSRLNASLRRSTSSTSSETLFRLAYDAEETPPVPCDSNTRSMGRLLYREDSFGRTWYRYDTAGRLLGEMRQRQGAGSTCNPMLETQYSYDSVGRLAGLRYPYGRGIFYVYGTGAEAGRVSGINVSRFTDTGSVVDNLITQIAWEPFGGLRAYQINPPSGPARSVEYAQGDNGAQPPANCSVGFPSTAPNASAQTGRLRSLRVSTGNLMLGTSNGDIYKRTYTWAADQVARIDTCLLGATTPRTELYAYDRTLRLTSAGRPAGNFDATGGAFASQSFTYDLRGNRKSFGEIGGLAWLLEYGTGGDADKLLSLRPQNDDFQRVSFAYDADGRVTRKESGRYLSGEAANVLDLRYSPSSVAEGQGSARETVFRSVQVNGATYSYYYDALGRRRAKIYPFNGVRDEFFHGAGNELLVDQGWDRILHSEWSYRVVDDYIWLAGRPIVLLRGRLEAGSDNRLSDTTAECNRNDEAASCGAYFPVTDHIGKPVLMLDRMGRVAGAADYEPFGHVNRVSLRDSTSHPYPPGDSETISGFAQPPENGQVQVRMRALYQFVDALEDMEVDYVELLDGDTWALLGTNAGDAEGRVIGHWLQPSNGRVSVRFVASPGYQSFTGVALEGYEYQRFQTGAQPFWTPLRFPGQYHDVETDLFENWNRYYDPSIGRYLQPEPLLATGPRVLSVYVYAGNNPLYFIDPDGRELRVHPSVRFFYPDKVENLEAAFAQLNDPACQCALSKGGGYDSVPWAERDIYVMFNPGLNYVMPGGADGFTYGGLGNLTYILLPSTIFLNPSSLTTTDQIAGTIAHEAGHFRWPYLGHGDRDRRFDFPDIICGPATSGVKEHYLSKNSQCSCR